MDILKELFIIASSLLCNFPLTGGDDNNLVEKPALGAWLKMFISNFFWLERTHFPVTLAPYIFKIFLQVMVGYTALRSNSTNCMEK